MIPQVCARQYGGELNIFHRLFSAAIYSDKIRDKLGTPGTGQRPEEVCGTWRGASWPDVTLCVIKSRDNQKNDL